MRPETPLYAGELPLVPLGPWGHKTLSPRGVIRLALGSPDSESWVDLETDTELYANSKWKVMKSGGACRRENSLGAFSVNKCEEDEDEATKAAASRPEKVISLLIA